MRAIFVLGGLMAVTLVWAHSVHAHGFERVQRELRAQGYDQLDFSRTTPPFKLDACREGERYHLHVDFYGKVTEQTYLGTCAEEIPADASRIEAAPGNDQSETGDCKRFMPEVGASISVPCNGN